MSKSVTIQITKQDYFEWHLGNPFKVGNIIKINGEKRLCFKVKKTSKEPHQYAISVVKVYKPSPKSRLKNKTFFSKIKCEIV